MTAAGGRWTPADRTETGWADHCAASIRASTRDTCMALHSPPRAVRWPRSFSPAAISRNVAAPDAWSSSMNRARLAARSSALSRRTAPLATVPPAVCETPDFSLRGESRG